MSAEQIIVKWQTPAEEAVSIARLAHELVLREVAFADQIGIIVPNASWGQQMKRACEAAGQPASACIGHVKLDAAAREALALLALLAQPSDEQARKAWYAFGHDASQAQALLEQHGRSRGFAVLRASGVSACKAFETALLHVQGDEEAPALLALINEQLDHPSVPKGSDHLVIAHYRQAAGHFTHTFLVGCVDGLIPDGRDLDEERAAFTRACGLASARAVISYFVEADAALAQAARIRSLRTRHVDGRDIAICHPTPFLREMGMARPTTTGGQTLLRAYGLN